MDHLDGVDADDRRSQNAIAACVAHDLRITIGLAFAQRLTRTQERRATHLDLEARRLGGVGMKAYHRDLRMGVDAAWDDPPIHRRAMAQSVFRRPMSFGRA